jgi:hypothetical protein
MNLPERRLPAGLSHYCGLKKTRRQDASAPGAIRRI